MEKAREHPGIHPRLNDDTGGLPNPAVRDLRQSSLRLRELVLSFSEGGQVRRCCPARKAGCPGLPSCYNKKGISS